MPRQEQEQVGLRTRPEDIGFHSKRVMFWIVDGRIEVAPLGTTMSHLEMAEANGWVDGDSTTEFFERNMRGFYLRGENRVHFYRGVGFGFDEEVVTRATEILPEIKDTLGLNGDTRVFFGPKDSLIGGVEYQIQFAGTVQQLLSEVPE